MYELDTIRDRVIESPGQGTDMVRAGFDDTLGTSLENLLLTAAAVSGIGNEADNRLTGIQAANFLDGGAGDDIIDGHLG